MSSVSDLKAKQQNYRTEIANARSQLGNYEKSYESLRAFKNIVSKSQEDFRTVNSKKLNISADVIAVKENSLTAQRYHAGMVNTFSGIGRQMTNVMYAALLASISEELKKYMGKIESYEGKIDYYKDKIGDLDDEIEVAKKAEELAKDIKGGNG